MSEVNCCDHHRSPRTSSMPVLLPVVACLLCPACMTLWTSLLAATGVRFSGIGHEAHGWMLGISLSIAVGTAVWSGVTTRRWTGAAATLLGSALLVSGHLGQVASLEWLGMAVLVGPNAFGALQHLRRHRVGAAH